MNLITLFFARYPLRLLLFYWLCFIFPFPLDLVGLPFQLIEPKNQPEWMKTPAEYYGKAYQWIYTTKSDVCKWVGPKVFDREVIIQMTGSGDTMRAYVGCFCAAVIAAGLALAWSFIMVIVNSVFMKWNGDRWLHGFVRVLVRYFLIQMLFGYGFAKVFPLQFAPPSYFRLNQQLGDMSPMGLLWTFMGFSTPYQMFTGAVEVLGGLLLITRRTTFLGSLVTLSAMTHIFSLNMCFDVPVKLYSFHYLAMALFLAAPDLPRLFSVLLLGRSAEAKTFGPLLGSKWCDRFGMVFRLFIISAMLYSQINSGYKRWSEMYAGPPAPVQGRWEKVTLQIDGKDADPNDVLNWKSLDFSNKSMVRLTSPNPPMMVYKVTWNADEKKMTLGKFSTPLWSANFTYNLSASDTLELNGTMDGKAIKGTFKLLAEKKSQLMDRGFHWIQEMPYNR